MLKKRRVTQEKHIKTSILFITSTALPAAFTVTEQCFKHTFNLPETVNMICHELTTGTEIPIHMKKKLI